MSFDREHSLAASALHKEATVLIKLGDLDAAIAKLKEAKTHLMQTWVGYSIDTWCRLPYVLQKDGRFDEAMTEMEFLLSDIGRRLRNLPKPNPGCMIIGPTENEYQQMEMRHRAVLWSNRRILQVREIKRLRKLKKKQK